jgi:hypothetical protein
MAVFLVLGLTVVRWKLERAQQVTHQVRTANQIIVAGLKVEKYTSVVLKSYITQEILGSNKTRETFSRGFLAAGSGFFPAQWAKELEAQILLGHVTLSFA